MKSVWLGLVAWLWFAQSSFAIDYPIVYVRAPRPADRDSRWPEIRDPVDAEPGTDLILLWADGSEELLVAGGPGAILDPCPDFNAEWVYYSRVHDLSQIGPFKDSTTTRGGADLYKISIATREIVRLTHQEFVPSTSLVPAGKTPQQQFGHGIYNMGPCVLPHGRVMFTSSRTGWRKVSEDSGLRPSMQLWVMDDDGANCEMVGFLNVNGVLHPTVLVDGRVMWSTHEDQAFRSHEGWGLFASHPDGRSWEPLLSAFGQAANAFESWHFQTQLSNTDIAAVHYYHAVNNGFGSIFTFPLVPPAGEPTFHSPNLSLAPRVEWGWIDHRQTFGTFKLPFQRGGLRSLTPWATSKDVPAAKRDGEYVGKVTHPSGAPNNDLLCVWTPGPANGRWKRMAPDGQHYDGGIYRIPGGRPVGHHRDLVLVKNDPRYNEMWPKALVPYQHIHGVPEPAALAWLPHEGHPELPPGSPYGLIGTSSCYIRESAPESGATLNWTSVGSDAGTFSNSEIAAIRLVLQEPTPQFLPNISDGFYMMGNYREKERLRILGEIPLRKFDAGGRPILDPVGDPDTSFLARVPADTSFTFQLIDDQGQVLTMAQTWHQVRPGEIRTDCNGCHAHHSPAPFSFDQTAAGQPGYAVARLTADPVSVEYHRDILPILSQYCMDCHSGSSPTGDFDMSTTRWINDQLRAKAFQSRTSPLGIRIHSDDPRQRMPPPEQPQLTDSEKLTITRWIGLGMPISEYRQSTGQGYWADTTRPTIHIDSPRSTEAGPTTELRIGITDAFEVARYSMTADWTIAGRSPGRELADLFSVSDGVFTLAIDPVSSGVLAVSATDAAGNVHKVVRAFGKLESSPFLPPAEEPRQVALDRKELPRMLKTPLKARLRR